VNRPTRITLVGMEIVLLSAIISSTMGHAQESGRTAKLLAMYQECVVEDIKSQIRNSRTLLNPSAASEIAFQSCRTEEQALFAHASTGGVSQSQANHVITDYKLNIKQQVRKIFAEAERDSVQRPARQIPAPALAPAPAPVVEDRAPPRPGCRGAYRRYDGEWVYINCN
jgi:hypothetical protein